MRGSLTSGFRCWNWMPVAVFVLKSNWLRSEAFSTCGAELAATGIDVCVAPAG